MISIAPTTNYSAGTLQRELQLLHVTAVTARHQSKQPVTQSGGSGESYAIMSGGVFTEELNEVCQIAYSSAIVSFYC